MEKFLITFSVTAVFAFLLKRNDYDIVTFTDSYPVCSRRTIPYPTRNLSTLYISNPESIIEFTERLKLYLMEDEKRYCVNGVDYNTSLPIVVAKGSNPYIAYQIVNHSDVKKRALVRPTCGSDKVQVEYYELIWIEHLVDSRKTISKIDNRLDSICLQT